MTIRGGAGPRGGSEPERERRPMARPIDASGTRRTSQRAGTVSAYELARGRPQAGIGGHLRFIVFLLIAAAVVLVALGTVLRPVTRSFVVRPRSTSRLPAARPRRASPGASSRPACCATSVRSC